MLGSLKQKNGITQYPSFSFQLYYFIVSMGTEARVETMGKLKWVGIQRAYDNNIHGGDIYECDH